MNITLLFLIFISSVAPASASNVEYQIEGYVSAVAEELNNGPVNVGDTISGTFYVNTDASYTDGADTFAIYNNSNLSLNIGANYELTASSGYVWVTNGSSTDRIQLDFTAAGGELSGPIINSDWVPDYYHNQFRFDGDYLSSSEMPMKIDLDEMYYGWSKLRFNIDDDVQIEFTLTNLSAAATVPTYTCNGFQSPLANGPVKVKKNRVLPVKAQLFNDTEMMTDANIVSPPVIQVTYQSSVESDPIDVTNDAYAVGFGTDGNIFEYNVADECWQYNLKTSNYTSPGTYTITMESGKDSEYLVNTCSALFVIE